MVWWYDVCTGFYIIVWMLSTLFDLSQLVDIPNVDTNRLGLFTQLEENRIFGIATHARAQFFHATGYDEPWSRLSTFFSDAAGCKSYRIYRDTSLY